MSDTISFLRLPKKCSHRPDEVNIEVESVRSPARANDRCHEEVGRKRRTTSLLILLLSVATTALISGCDTEMPLTRQPEMTGGIASTQAGGRVSNMGSLNMDSTADPPALPVDIIEPGDQVQIMVWGYPEFNTTTTVKNYGTIAVPLVGNVIAEGLTEKELSKELEQRLSEYVKGNARVTVSHVSMDKRISVMGAVNKQGNYPALGEMSLVEVIADAGGTATDADLRHVKIFRQGKYKDVDEVDLQHYLENGSLDAVPGVNPGDTVFIPAEENLIRQIARYGQEVMILFGFFALLH